MNYRFVAALLVCLWLPSKLVKAAETICEDGSIANNSIVNVQAPLSQVTRCSLGNVGFIPTATSSLNVIDSTVSAGSLVTVTFTGRVFAATFTSIQFQADAHFAAEGTPAVGASLTIEKCKFDVSTPVANGDIIAIDLRRLYNMLQYWGVVIQQNKINISSSQAAKGLVAAIAYSPEWKIGSIAAINRLTLTYNIIVFNTTDVAFGLHCAASYTVGLEVTFKDNILYHMATGGVNVTAFYINLPQNPINKTSYISTLVAFSNVVTNIRMFIHIDARIQQFSITYNRHSHFAEAITNITSNISYDVLSTMAFTVSYNVFETTYEPWNPQSNSQSPIFVLWAPSIGYFGTLNFLHNDFYASRYTKPPIQFTGANNMFADTVFNLQDNYFTTNQLTATSIPMASFNSSTDVRTTDLGVVYICSNIWPAVFVAATTTLTAPTTTLIIIPPSATPRSYIDPMPEVVSLLVEGVGRPANITMSGGLCPIIVTTRQPIANHGPALTISGQMIILMLAIGLVVLCH